MKKTSLLPVILEAPRLIMMQSISAIRRAVCRPAAVPEVQQGLAELVNSSLYHEIRAGYEHRFIRLMFVTVNDRVFCRQYQFGKHSWRDVFLRNPQGQVRLDNTVININARKPDDLDHIIPAVDEAYAHALRKTGASFLLAGAVEPRAQQSTMEIFLWDDLSKG